MATQDQAHQGAEPAGKTFYVQNFGCRATQSDGAALAAQLTGRGLAPAEVRRLADLVVVNTCTVTNEADRDARQAVRRIHRENPGAQILVTGCYAQRRPQELAGLPGVKWVVGNTHKPVIPDILAPAFVPLAGLESAAGLAYHGEVRSGGTLVGDISEQQKFLGAAVLDSGPDRHRPNLKIQDGCHNRCSFCVIPSVRGNSRSAEPERVIHQVRHLAERYPEIVITGINLGRWGRELSGRPRLVQLLRRVLHETEIHRLRLSSIEPMDWSDELLEFMAASDRICRHVHIPLQSGSDSVLRAMRRRYRVRHYETRVARARRLMPQAAIGADVMVGFPGETEEDFERTRAFIEAMPFTYLHVFTYSERPGTPAAVMGNSVPMALRKERNQVLRDLAARKNQAFRKSLVGRRLGAVTIDGGEDAAALTGNYVRVAVRGACPPPGRLVEIQVLGVKGGVTIAEAAGKRTPGP